MTPNPCDILAIDPGRTSGVAVFRSGTLVEAAEVNVSSSLVEWWVGYALNAALTAGVTLVMVGETWGRGGMRGMKQWQGIGASWKRWEWALEEEWKRARELGHKQPAPKVIRVHTSTWRSKVFGGKVGKDMAKRMAVETANSRFGAGLEDTQHNAAEAVCIGHWATYAPEVLAKIPPKFRHPRGHCLRVVGGK